MKKDKVQQFIANLQKKCEEVNNEKRRIRLLNVNTEQTPATMSLSNPGETEEEENVYTDNGYITVTGLSNGVLPNETTVGNGFSIIITLDLAQWAQDNRNIVDGVEEIARVHMTVAGMNKMGHGLLSVYQYPTNQLIGRYSSVDNIFKFDFAPSADLSGKVRIKLVGEGWQTMQSFPASFMEFRCYKRYLWKMDVVEAPYKLSYIENEVFDVEGLVLRLTYNDETHKIWNIGNAPSVDGDVIEDSPTFLPSLGTPLREADETMQITYDGVSIKLPLMVKSAIAWENFGYGISFERRSRSAIGAEWSSWTNTDNNGEISVWEDETALYQRRTILTLHDEAVNTALAEKKGIRLLLRKHEESINVQGYIRVNGQRKYIDGNATFIELDAGALKTIKNNGNRIIFEPCGVNIRFDTNNYTPFKTYYFLCNGFTKNANKSIGLLREVETKLDLCTGEAAFVLEDFSSANTLLRLGINHVFRYDNDNYGVGHRLKLNLHQTLYQVEEYQGQVKAYEYTDGFGNKTRYYNYFYFIDAEGRHNYYAIEETTDRISLIDGVLWDNEKDCRVYYSDTTIQRELLCGEAPQSTSAITYYNDICSQQTNVYLCPQTFLVGDQVVKGFNCEGDLVWLNDQYGNYISLEYQEGKIVSLKNQNGNCLQFLYNDKGLLNAIFDSLSRKRVEYTYDPLMANGTLLTKIEYKSVSAAYKTVELEYESVGLVGAEDILTDAEYILTGAQSSDGEKCILTYGDKLEGIKKYSLKDKIPNGGTVDVNENYLMWSIDIDCSMQPFQTVLINEQQDQEVYRFNEKKELTAYYQIVNGLVAKAENYYNVPFVSYEVHKARHDQLNQVPLLDFHYVNGESEVVKLNEYNLPVRKLIDGIQLNDATFKHIVIDYEYDDNYRCVKEVSMENYSDETSFKYVAKHTYNEKGALVKTISYTAGEEATTGITAEEYTYDEQGHLICSLVYKKVCSTNEPDESEYEFDSASTNTIFCSEKSYNPQGLLWQQKDETGLHQTTYQYVGGTSLVRTILHPNNCGVNFAYNSSGDVLSIGTTINGVSNANIMGYTDGQMTEVDYSGNTDYLNYEYDFKRRLSLVKFGTAIYHSRMYEDKVLENGVLVDKMTITNAKNESIKQVVDRAGTFDRLYYTPNATAAEQLLLERTYDNHGQIVHISDHLSNEETSIGYNSSGKLVDYSCGGVNGTYMEHRSYDSKGRIENVSCSGIVNRTMHIVYEENSQGRVKEFVVAPFKYKQIYDEYGRVVRKEVRINNIPLDRVLFSYRKEGVNATHQVSEIVYEDNQYLSYTYDAMGNISEVRCNGGLMSRYAYDGLNRLTREDDVYSNKTYLYTYDANGNIKTKEMQTFTTGAVTPGLGSLLNFNYNDKGQMTSYNNMVCEYDGVGNPVVYAGKQMSWTRGRTLVSCGNVQFAYDAQGRRIQKNTTRYYYNSAGQLIASSDGMEYFYGPDGCLGFSYNGQRYAYRKNLQGDIIAILDNTGAVVVQYVYDAWGASLVLDGTGNVISSSSHIGQLNPFRYRGYFYDVETGFYYLKSRYYNPVVGRFINMDSISFANPKMINGLNLYSYCNNNPVMYVDPSGTDAILITAYEFGPGLPIVGHSVVLLEVDGKWYYTEFRGDFPDKSTATVVCDLVDPEYETVDAYISKTYGTEGYKGILGYNRVDFSGDFSAAYAEAVSWNGKAFNGGYHFLFNNCWHYAKAILQKGKNVQEQPNMDYLYDTNNIIPVLAPFSLAIRTVVDSTIQEIENAWEQSAIKKGFDAVKNLYLTYIKFW